MKNFFLLILAIGLTASGGLLAYTYLEETNDENVESNQPVRIEDNGEIIEPAMVEKETIRVVKDAEYGVSLVANNPSNISVNVSGNEGTEIRSFRMAVEYNPNELEIIGINNGDLDLYIGKEIDNQRGFATISGSISGENQISGSFEFAEIEVNKLVNTASRIELIGFDSADSSNASTYVTDDSEATQFQVRSVVIEI